MLRVLFAVFVVIIVCGGTNAEDAAPITAVNIPALASVGQIDFADAPVESGRLESGSFVMDESGRYVAVRSRESIVSIWDTQGQFVEAYNIPGADGLPMTVLNNNFVIGSDTPVLASLVTDGIEYSAVLHQIGGDGRLMIQAFPVPQDIPVAIWAHAQLGGTIVWLEISPASPHDKPYIASMPIGFDDPPQGLVSLLIAWHAEINDVFVRIGRVALPYAVTTSQNGLVKLWNLETRDLLASAQVSAPAVFGAINTGATHLAWRDPESQALHLLDFGTGADKIVAALDGTYLQYILLTPAADVILGVGVGQDHVVTAWDTTTGERYELGAFRACRRMPDMARLSLDGALLVIGCDGGLEFWRILESGRNEGEARLAPTSEG